MPNWCYNSLSVSHENPEMIERFVKATENESLLKEFCPIPEEISNTTSPSPDNVTLIEKYGASDWYSWSLNNWGTKWDISDAYADCIDKNSVTASFNTAWSPPIQFYHKLVTLGFTVDATYTEEGMGFAGHFENGVDDCIDLDFDDKSQGWIDQIDDETLREVVQDQFDQWFEYNEEILRQNEYEAKE